MSDSIPRLSDDQARALWRRAAELQAAAEQAATQGRTLRPAEERTLSLEQVAAAAEGAGIDADYLRVAIAEQRLPDSHALRHDHWTSTWLQRLMRQPQAIETERVITASPEAVLTAFRAIAVSDRFLLQAEDVVGEDPIRDAVLVYRVTAGGLAGPMFLADGRVLLVTIRPHENGTRVRVRVPTFASGFNLLLTGGSAGLFGGGVASAAGGIATSLGAAAAIAAIPVAAGAVAGGALGVAAFRRVYRWSRRQGSTGVEQLLQAVALEAEGRRERLTG